MHAAPQPHAQSADIIDQLAGAIEAEISELGGGALPEDRVLALHQVRMAARSPLQPRLRLWDCPAGVAH